MNSLQLHAPEPFNFKNPDDWPRWKRRFEQYHSASGLAKEDDARQANTLLYCMGEEADDVLTSTGISSDARQKYKSVMSKFDEFFKVRRNTIFERAKFNRRNQLEGEPAEQYITALYSLVETCDYGEFKEQLLRDRIVVGIRDTALSERLQLDPDLTLDKVKREVRQKEAVKQHSRQLQEGIRGDPIILQEVKEVSGKTHTGGVSQPKGRFQPKKGRLQKPPGGASSASLRPQCKRCGREHRPGDRCPARAATCYRCNKKGHFSTQCHTKTPVKQELQLDAAFLGPVTAGIASPWTVSLHIENQELTFKLDTGAEVTAITEQDCLKLRDIILQEPTRMLYGPTGQTLQAVGQFQATISSKGTSSLQTVYVVRGLRNNLLGLPAISALELANRIGTFSEKLEVQRKFPDLFHGLGILGDQYEIKLREGAQPYSLHAPRSVPLPLRERVRQELQRMERGGVISKVQDPTPWCAGIVVVPKKAGAVRICVDLKALNESVQREIYPIPKVDETLAQLTGATMFSKLDANSGFWQIPLARKSRLLTTFITPFGRYCFNKLPFGISSAPELFQRRMNKLLEGLDGVLCHMDDVLIFGRNQSEHDTRLLVVLKRLDTAGITLNAEKCLFGVESVKFLGYIIDKRGIRADPEKTSAILQMEPPKTVTELRRFMGMVNQLGKFSSTLAETSRPLRELLCKDRAWMWGSSQEEAFAAIKAELVKPTVLALYDPTSETKISADASSYGVGAVLLQEQKGEWRPVSFASRALSETEQRYAQIEKEALATVWACEKFAAYILGKRISIETDHKPLVPLLGTKRLDDMPPRILRFRLRLSRFEYDIKHVPGKYLYTADTLSRAPQQATTSADDATFETEVEGFIGTIVRCLPATEKRLEAYRKAQADDTTCAQVASYCRNGWPERNQITADIHPYWEVRTKLSLHDNLLLYGNRIVVPIVLRTETLQKLHSGHQGIQRCRSRANDSVWWPGLTKQILETVQSCSVCAEHSTPHYEPMIASKLPDYPWQVVGSDLFWFRGDHYLLVVDYYSRFPEVIRLPSTTASTVVPALKAIFARHGIPEVVFSDNGPQYDSHEMESFAFSYGFHHVTSSPHYPQSNGQAERTVQTMKRLMKKAGDPHLALLTYRSTPLPWCGLSPTQLLMGRRVRSNLPQVKQQLVPQWPYLPRFRYLNNEFKRKQVRVYNRRHRAHPLSTVPDNAEVWIASDNKRTPGTVTRPAETPRSYWVETPAGHLRRNRRHIIMCPKDTEVDQPQISAEEPSQPRSPIKTRSQTGTEISRPQRLTY